MIKCCLNEHHTRVGIFNIAVLLGKVALPDFYFHKLLVAEIKNTYPVIHISYLHFILLVLGLHLAEGLLNVILFIRYIDIHNIHLLREFILFMAPLMQIEFLQSLILLVVTPDYQMR